MIDAVEGILGPAMGLELYKFDVDLPDDVSLALVICGELGAEEQRHTGFVVRNMMGRLSFFIWLLIMILERVKLVLTIITF